MSKEYDYINPTHYQKNGKECIDVMIEKFGKEAVITFCELNAFKYNFRKGNKPGEDLEREENKIKWYLDKANELRNSI